MKTKIRENRVHAGIRDDQRRDAGKRLLNRLTGSGAGLN
jgi:hypothetical protein